MNESRLIELMSKAQRTGFLTALEIRELEQAGLLPIVWAHLNPESRHEYNMGQVPKELPHPGKKLDVRDILKTRQQNGRTPKGAIFQIDVDPRPPCPHIQMLDDMVLEFVRHHGMSMDDRGDNPGQSRIICKQCPADQFGTVWVIG